MLKHYRAAGKITNDVRRDRHPVAVGENLNRLNAVVKRGLRGTLPCLDRRMSLMGFTFIFHDGICGKAVLNVGDIATMLIAK